MIAAVRISIDPLDSSSAYVYIYTYYLYTHTVSLSIFYTSTCNCVRIYVCIYTYIFRKKGVSWQGTYDLRTPGVIQFALRIHWCILFLRRLSDALSSTASLGCLLHGEGSWCNRWTMVNMLAFCGLWPTDRTVWQIDLISGWAIGPMGYCFVSTRFSGLGESSRHNDNLSLYNKGWDGRCMRTMINSHYLLNMTNHYWQPVQLYMYNCITITIIINIH